MTIRIVHKNNEVRILRKLANESIYQSTDDEALSNIETLTQMGSFSYFLEQSLFKSTHYFNKILDVVNCNTLDHLMEMMLPDSQKKFMQSWSRLVINDQSLSAEVQFKHNASNWYLVKANIFSEGSGTVIRGIIQDITTSKVDQKNNALIMAAAKMGNWSYNIINSEYTLDELSQKILCLSEIKGDWLDGLQVEEKLKFLKELQLSITVQKPLETFFRIHNGSEGEIRYISCRALLAFPYISGVFWDDTTRVNAELRFKQSEMHLVQAARMSALGEVAGGLAHEINNPLTIISGKVYLLNKYIKKNNYQADEFQKQLALIDDTTHRIARIIQGLLSFSRPLDNDPMNFVSMSVIMKDTLNLCTEKLKVFGIKLMEDYNPDLKIYCHGSQLAQVMLNLMQNSIDAVLDLEERWIKIQVEQIGTNTVIKITDSGKGISKEVQSKMMIPFYTTKFPKGSGLGLSISRSIIYHHSGELEYDADSPNTKFIITLPITRTPEHL